LIRGESSANADAAKSPGSRSVAHSDTERAGSIPPISRLFGRPGSSMDPPGPTGPSLWSGKRTPCVSVWRRLPIGQFQLAWPAEQSFLQKNFIEKKTKKIRIFFNHEILLKNSKFFVNYLKSFNFQKIPIF
jgi:hypothetical protein